MTETAKSNWQDYCQ